MTSSKLVYNLGPVEVVAVVGGLGPHEQLVVLNNLLECEKLVHILISTSKQVVHLGRFEIMGKKP